MTQGSLPRSFKAIRVGRSAVDNVDRRPSKINESWETSQEVSRQSDLRAAKSSMDDNVDRRQSATIKNKSPTGQLFVYAKTQVHMWGQNEAYDKRKPPRSFKAIRLARGQIFDGRRRGSLSASDAKINHPLAIRVSHPEVDHVDRRP
ncbi:uncharacterized protein G2W53_027080 [Senna tora]|uniref:Uncharacterized protein n=1 Tax=Senna tora TaxID=362788 RepID=A0A834TGX4_9FABA|nr:uncharacterized protein G2W53_027080 [Senna tora]